MKRFFLAFLVLLSFSVHLQAATSSPVDVPITVTPQTISSIVLSNTSTTTGLSSGTAVGTFSASMTPATPTFTYTTPNLSLVTSGATCNATNGAGNSSFQVVNDTLETNGTPAAGTYKICVNASETGVSAAQQAFTITVGHLIDAAASYCAANGGGNGTTGSPWQDTCIQAAVNAASNGDTVFLAAGNWKMTVAPTLAVSSATSNGTSTVTFNLSASQSSISVGDNLFAAGFTPSSYNGYSGSGWAAATAGTTTITAACGGSNPTCPPLGSASVVGTINGCQGSPIITSKTINLVGAGSGNNFDSYSHPLVPTGTLASPNTRVFQSGFCGNLSASQGGYIEFNNASAPVVSHIFFDGSVGSAGGDNHALLNFANSPNNVSNDILVYANGTPTTMTGESQFYVRDQAAPSPPATNATVKNSVFAEPPGDVSGGNYFNSQIFQNSAFDGFTVDNNVFYMFMANLFYIDNITFTRNYTEGGCDATGCSGQGVYSTNLAGCQSTGCYNGGSTGNSHLYYRNNWFNANSTDYAIGGGVNDVPAGGGIMNDLAFTGNWVTTGGAAVIDSCIWRIYGYCQSTPNLTATQGAQLNGNGSGTTVQNNSLVGTSGAQVNDANNGCDSYALGALCTGSTTLNWAQTVNWTATKNYLSSSSNTRTTDSHSITPSVTGNFCTSSGSGFSQTDATTCATTGFNTSPTVSFTLNPLGLGGIVTFNVESFTAQYGAVQWLTSTSSTTPTSSGQTGASCGGSNCSWSHLPPVSLAAAHGNTVYMWTMDSANHISAAASQLVP